jgi:hypothetical protein
MPQALENTPAWNHDPPGYPPQYLVFHGTPLDTKIRNPQYFLGIIALIWILLDGLKQVRGSEGSHSNAID